MSTRRFTTSSLSSDGRTLLRALTPPADTLQVVAENAELPEATVMATLEELIDARLVKRVEVERGSCAYELTPEGYAVIGPRHLDTYDHLRGSTGQSAITT